MASAWRASAVEKKSTPTRGSLLARDARFIADPRRAETVAELARLRAAHETRVADAESALEEGRQLDDAEATAHAAHAAEAGVSAALEEARGVASLAGALHHGDALFEARGADAKRSRHLHRSTVLVPPENATRH